MANFLKFASGALFSISALAAIAIAVIVFVNGTWPDFLAPVKRLLEINYSILGIFNWLGIVAIVAGPAALLAWLSEIVENRASRR